MGSNRQISSDAWVRTADDEANAALSFRFIRALAVEKAVLDPRLDHACAIVLAAINYFMNSQTLRAWPSYDRISEITGYGSKTIERAVRSLIDKGYLFTERRAPITGGRALVHYGLKRIAPADLEDVVTAAVIQYRDGLTRQKITGSEDRRPPAQKPTGETGDPVNFVPSDPVKSLPQKHVREEPVIGVSAKSRAPCLASLKGSEVEGLGNGVDHIWEALVAQSLGSQPKGDDVRIWKAAVSRWEDCRRISETEAHELASVIAKAERFWPAAARVAEAVASRASRERARLSHIAEYEAWRPLREAYIADKNRFDEIAETVPEPTWEDAKALAEQMRKSGDRPNVSAAEQKLYADRKRRIASLAQEAGIDLDRHPLEARESKPEPSKTPTEFRWPDRETQGRSKQSAKWAAGA